MKSKEQQAIDIFCNLELMALQGGILVGQVMTEDPVSASSEQSVAEIVKIIYSNPFHHLPVIDDENQLVGIVSDRDFIRCFCRNTNGKAVNLNQVMVSEIMHTDLMIVTPETKLMSAVEIMNVKGTSCIPVTSDGELVGILTDSDFWEILLMTLEAMKEPSIMEMIMKANLDSNATLLDAQKGADDIETIKV